MDHPGFFQRQVQLHTSQCDLLGAARLSTLLELMQDTANDHCSLLHRSRFDLKAQGLAWVLFKLEAEIDRYPGIREQVTVQTFTKGNRFKFYPRCYRIVDGSGTCICRGASLWMLMDLKTRKTVSPKDSGITLPDVTTLEPPIPISSTVPELEGEGETRFCRPAYSDLDLNGHVNNVRYADWLCDRLGIARMKEMQVAHLSVSYNYEVSADMTLCTTLILREPDFRFCGESEGKTRFQMYGRLSPRQPGGQWE